MKTPQPLVEISSLEKVFPGSKQPALVDISATLQAGRITGLVGPDGAGKTTLMRLMAGLLIPTKGSLRIDGFDPVKEPDKLHAYVGYMPQKFGLYEDLTVQENLDLHAELRGVVGEERQKIFERLLNFTDLKRFTDRLAGALSGGMKQKLGLACSLLGHPKLLLLDEPSVGVDPISRRELWSMVHELISGGMAVVWSTSYLDEAELCDEVLLMNEGKLLFSGKPADLTKNIKDRSFEITHIDGNRRELLTRTLRCPEVMDGVIQGKNIRIVLRKGAQLPSLQTLKAGENASYEPTPPRFEDAFIEVLGGGPGGDSLLADQLKEVPGHHEVVIEAVELTKKFGNFTATDHVNFSVKRGEIFGLLGPNGAGKSTTFRMMCGLLIPTSGTAHVMGIDLRESPSKARQKLGYMAQKFSLYQDLTVRQNLYFFSGVYGLQRARQKEAVDEMVEVFKLQPFLDITPGTLPLGFKQRLALACAVMHQPPILFLDEPTSGVDPVTRREFWMHINGAVSKGVTVMVTTHFMDEASYCDRIALVYRGKMIAIGTPDELKDQVATPELPNPTMEDAFIGLIEQYSAVEVAK